MSLPQNTTQEREKTLDQTIEEWLRLSPEEIEGFNFEKFEISFSDYTGYQKKFSEAIHTTFYAACEEVYKKNPSARPLLLKYILDKERDVVEEVVTENFLNNLVQKITTNYNREIEAKLKELEKCKNDKERLKSPESQKLQQAYEQYSIKIQNNIGKLNQDIKTIKNHKHQLASYNTYTDKITKREKILLHAKRYNPEILNNELTAEVEKKFTEYFTQLDAKKTMEKYLNVYYKVKKYEESIELSDDAFLSIIIGGVIVMFIAQACVAVLYGSNPEKDFYVSMGVHLSLISIIVLLMTTPIAIITAVRKCAMHDSINDLVFSNLNSQQEVSTSEGKNNLQPQESNDNSPTPTAPPESQVNNALTESNDQETTMYMPD